MLAAAARRAAALAEEMGTQAMSIAMWSFAKLRFYPEAFAAAAADAACTRLGAFEPQVGGLWDPRQSHSASLACCASTMPVCLAMVIPWPRFPISLPLRLYHTTPITPVLSLAPSQGLSMLLWAYATLGRHPGKLLWASAAEVARQLPQMEAQHVANVMWVYATLGHQPGKLMQEAGDEAASRLSEMKPQEVSTRLSQHTGSSLT